MKLLFVLTLAAFGLTGCAEYHDHHGNPHGCPPGLAKQGRCWEHNNRH